MKSKNISTGLSILIVVFVAICMFTFVSIVLASAKQSDNHASTLSERQQNYYTAVSHAEQTIASSLQTDGEYEKTFIINDDETLLVAYTVTNNTYTIRKWQIINMSEWEPDTHINLIR